MRRIDLNHVVSRLEDGILTLSGPALATSGIIAGVDLLTGGHMLQQTPWLALTWAICLLLALDFTVLTLGARAHRAYMSHLPIRQKVVEIAITIVIAAGISLVSVQMQAIIARLSTVGTITMEQAAVQMGINSVALIWERSALVLVLIFLSGWFRSDVVPETVRQEAEQPVPATTISEETLGTILVQLAKLDAIEEAIAGVALSPTSVAEEVLELPEHAGAMDETEGETADDSDLEHQVEVLVALLPDIPSRKAAEILKRPHSTVYRHLARAKQRAKQAERSAV